MKRMLIVVMLVLVSMVTPRSAVGQSSPAEIAILKKKAAAGDASAQYSLGDMYSNGKGVPENKTEAVKWYRLAAAQGNASAQYNLGVMYSSGEGVPEDYVQAYKWYNLAAAAGDTRAVKNKNRVAEKMTKEQIVEAQRRSTAFKPTKTP